MLKTCLTALLSLLATTAVAGEVRVAVAANFHTTLIALAAEFETRSGHRVVISPGSTGRHYAQIINGAPFDVFLAADMERPARLVAAGKAAEKNRFDYATGQPALWTPGKKISDDPQGWVTNLQSIAIANPRHAPYGVAAQETLQRLSAPGSNLRIISGENVSQAFQFVASGNVQGGFVALSQLLDAQTPVSEYRVIPVDMYTPIRQQGVLLSNREVPRAFTAFLSSEDAREIIRKHGYLTPDKATL